MGDSPREPVESRLLSVDLVLEVRRTQPSVAKTQEISAMEMNVSA